MPSLDLSVRCDSTQWGQVVAVLGSWNSWDKRNLTVLQTCKSSFPLWSVSIQVPHSFQNKSVEYKYVIACDAQISRWESNAPHNRVIAIAKRVKTSDVFGQIPTPAHAKDNTAPPAPSGKEWRPTEAQPSTVVSVDKSQLDPLENAIVSFTFDKRSWRQRLAYVRSLFTETDVATAAAFDPMSIDALTTISVYLTFLSSGQIRCDEDGGHHRPNHHAHEARRIEAALARIIYSVHNMSPTAQSEKDRLSHFIPYVVRKIFPLLPSYSTQFTVSVPLTRIRDIAHRGDIPRDLKQEIKHTLQNKLHRCAGPEDLHTSAHILNRISHGGFSQPFVDQFRIFHAELEAFFNAASLDDRLRYLQGCVHTHTVAGAAGTLLGLKNNHGSSLNQLQGLTTVRDGISKLEMMTTLGRSEDEPLPDEDVQKTRLADIDLEAYAFLQLAAEAKHIEECVSPDNFPWQRALEVLSLAMQNMRLSSIRAQECGAIAAELLASSRNAKVDGDKHRNDALRVKAAVDRALRFTHSFSDTIVSVFERRAHTIGQALGVERHAIDVFAEAEIRSNVTFQASRVATACCMMYRRVLSLPPWDALHLGETHGSVVYVEALADVAGSVSNYANNGSGDTIVVARFAEGDEDVPTFVKGVVLGRALPHLSHLGVRARQAGVVFVCAEERDAFETVWREQKSGTCVLTVTAREGLARLENSNAQALANGNGHSNGLGKGQEAGQGKVSESTGVPEKSLQFDIFEHNVLDIANTTRRNASSKCAVAGMLVKVARESGGLFEAPTGVALPHGIFHCERERHGKKYKQLVQGYNELHKAGHGSDKLDAHAEKIASFVKDGFDVAAAAVSSIQKAMRGGKKVMVRSSANAEDLETMSGAGLYDSIANVNVHDESQLVQAIKSVWASLWTKRAASSRMGYKVEHEQVSMAVLVQEMVESEISFVAFSREPVGHGSDLYIEMAVGMGETLASATTDGSPYRFRVSRDGMYVETVSFGSYSESLVPVGTEQGDAKGGLQSAVVDYSRERMTTDCQWRIAIVQCIAKTVLTLEKAFDRPQDVEGSVTTEGASEFRVFVVQARPQIL